MTDQLKVSIQEDSNEISLGDIIKKTKFFFKYLWKKRLNLSVIGIVGCFAGFGYYYIQTPKYIAETTFILQEKSSSLGGLSNLASSFGMDIGGLSGGNIFAGDNILEVIPSKKIVQKVLLTTVEYNSQKQTLADLYLDFSKIKKAWLNKPLLSNINFQHKDNLTLLQDSVLQIVYRNIVKNNLAIERANKKASIIRVTVTSKNSIFSKFLSERVVNESLDFYKQVKTSVSQKNVDRLEAKADSIVYLLNKKTYAAADIKIIDPNPTLKILQVPNEMLVRDKTILLTLYGEVVKNLEIARMTLAQETPIIQILDQPGQSIYDNKLRKLFSIAIICLVFLFFAVLFFIVKFSLKKSNQS